jgi:hypothetical protein
MGFFSRLWKGIKKVAKKVFMPIKSVFKQVGKFSDCYVFYSSGDRKCPCPNFW